MTSACGRYIGGGSIIFEIQGFYDSKISCKFPLYIVTD
uniref:Uncharacterized protein n=1 Tax=Lepeophtheirus salmonis TaxID=72036 RepID=A0A0K2VKX6_LEPSM